MTDTRVQHFAPYAPTKTVYYWIVQGSEHFGPFDTQRDAFVAQKILARYVDWLNWHVMGEEA